MFLKLLKLNFHDWVIFETFKNIIWTYLLTDNFTRKGRDTFILHLTSQQNVYILTIKWTSKTELFKYS